MLAELVCRCVLASLEFAVPIDIWCGIRGRLHLMSAVWGAGEPGRRLGRATLWSNPILVHSFLQSASTVNSDIGINFVLVVDSIPVIVHCAAFAYITTSYMLFLQNILFAL